MASKDHPLKVHHGQHNRKGVNKLCFCKQGTSSQLNRKDGENIMFSQARTIGFVGEQATSPRSMEHSSIHKILNFPKIQRVMELLMRDLIKNFCVNLVNIKIFFFLDYYF